MGIGFGMDVDGDGTNDLYFMPNSGGKKRPKSRCAGRIPASKATEYVKKFNIASRSAVILGCKFCKKESLQYTSCCWCGQENAWDISGAGRCFGELYCTRCKNIFKSDNCRLCGKENHSLNFWLLQHPDLSPPGHFETGLQNASSAAAACLFTFICVCIFLFDSLSPSTEKTYSYLFTGTSVEIKMVTFHQFLWGGLAAICWVTCIFHFVKSKAEIKTLAAEWDSRNGLSKEDNSINPSTSHSSFKEISQQSINSVTKPFSVLKKAITGELDTEESIESTPSQNMQTDAIWIMKPNGQVGGPFTKERLRQLKSQGKLPQGMKASRSKDGPWKEMPTG